MMGVRCIRDGCPYSGRECELWNDCPIFVADRGLRKNAEKDRAAAMPRPTEEEEQGVVKQFCELCKITLVHIPNEGKRSYIAGAKLKAIGMQKGFPDLFVPEARNGFHGLFIEMKRDRTRKPTKEQKEWITLLNEKGYLAVVCYGAAEAIEQIRSYMGV